MSTEALSTFEQAEAETIVGFYKALFRMVESAHETCIPAIVEERENESGLVKVKPLANWVKQTDKGPVGVVRQSIYVRPLKAFHGGFTIRLPLFVGDTGYVIACDRDCTTAISRNSSILEEDQKEDGSSENKGPSDPDSMDRPQHPYGFFIPCSWFKDNGDERRREFGEDSGVFRDHLVIANSKMPNSKGACHILLTRDGRIEIRAESTFAVIGESGITIEREDEKATTGNEEEEEEPKRTTVTVDGNGIKASRAGLSLSVSGDSVSVGKEGDDKTVSVSLGHLRTSAEFRELKVLAGEPTKNGEIVSIPYMTANVLCDEPSLAGTIDVNIKDPE